MIFIYNISFSVFNFSKDKDPASYGNKTLEDSTRNVLRIRYTILPYIYTMFYHVHSKGGSVARPLFFEY
jgi:lysosomal alpha-glucosidase